MPSHSCLQRAYTSAAPSTGAMISPAKRRAGRGQEWSREGGRPSASRGQRGSTGGQGGPAGGAGLDQVRGGGRAG
eukprot:1132199-Prymnesium_polylepis.1